jgi:hypothetical protein
MKWNLTRRADPRAARLADRHYSRQTIGATQFAPPGRCMVLLTSHADAVWVTSWPYPEYVLREWKDAWICTLFRNEGPYLSSDLIREAVAVTRWKYGRPPESGMITMINQNKVRSTNPGCCYKKAGFQHVGFTKNGLYVVQLQPSAMPEPALPNGAQLALFEATVRQA